MNYSNLTNADYHRLVSYTIGILNSKKYHHIQGEDIVHNAFLELYNRKIDYSFENMRPLLLQGITGYTNQLLNSNTVGMVQKKDNIFGGIEMKNCRYCNELLPVSFFYKLREYPDGTTTYHAGCKECHKENCAKAKAKKLADPIYYEQYLTKCAQSMKNRKAIISNNPLLKEHFRNKKNQQEAIYRMNKRLKTA